MIVYCCMDLFFSSKIKAQAKASGIVSRPARDAQALRERLDQVDDGKAHDPVTGIAVDLDLGQTAMELIRLAKSHPGAPLVAAFGPHGQTALLTEAAESGADFVLPRSAFTANLATVLQRLNGTTG